jgi:AspT/YidE/YbjL antiporter-like protein
MWTWLVEMLRTHPEMAVVLTLGFGYWIGKIRIGALALGAVVGVLIAGAIIGQVGVKPSSDLKTLFFLLFLFSIGYRTGPQFFSGLRSSGFPQIALTIVFCVTALALAYLAARIFRYDSGTAGGLLAGATTESATVGTATDAINRLGIDPVAKQALLSNIAVAFAVTYFSRRKWDSSPKRQLPRDTGRSSCAPFESRAKPAPVRPCAKSSRRSRSEDGASLCTDSAAAIRSRSLRSTASYAAAT